MELTELSQGMVEGKGMVRSDGVYVTVKGRWVEVPSTVVNDRTVVVTGRWIKMAAVHDEEWLKDEPVTEPEGFMAKLQSANLSADIFTFGQKLPECTPKYSYYMEWDNVAAIPTTSYRDWWENRLPQVTRKNVRRSLKRGVIVKPFLLTSEAVEAIFRLYNEIPKKQGVAFAHFGKDLETVRRELSTFSGQSEFLGAFVEDKLIGFIKMLYMGRNAGIMHIVSRDCDYDKRPANALIAKAVELCEAKGILNLIYGKYVYGNKTDNPLTEYKRRNGFEQVLYPRYYIPLNFKGRVILRLRLHRGLLGLLPSRVITLLIALRAWVVRKTERNSSLTNESTGTAGSRSIQVPDERSED